MSSAPSSQNGDPDQNPDSGRGQTPPPPHRSRRRRAGAWFSGLSEAGKVALITAVITTVGGGAFGVVNAVIPVVTGQDEGDKAGSGTSKNPAHSALPSGRTTADAEPDTSKSSPKCDDYPGRWKKMGNIGKAADFDAARMDVKFADINGDGLDDYLVVHRGTGSVKAWKNLGEINEANQFRWGETGVQLTHGTGRLTTKDDIDFADIDGDGRDDYLMVNRDTGAVKGWKTGAGKEWQIGGADALGQPDWTADARIPRAAAGHTKAVFADIDGNGRDDHLTLDTDSGTVQAWLNRKSSNGDQPDWKHIEPFTPARLNEGDSPAFHNVDCNKRADYLVSTAAKPLRVSLNEGITSEEKPAWGKQYQIANGGEFNPATQRRDFADLDGDGRDDVLWITTETGEVTPHLNKGGDPPL